MDGYLKVLLFAAMPALGNFLGGLLDEFLNVSQKPLSLALHLAAGIILAVVGIELMPQALEAEQKWLVFFAFFLGALFFILLIERLIMSGIASAAKEHHRLPLLFISVSLSIFSLMYHDWYWLNHCYGSRIAVSPGSGAS